MFSVPARFLFGAASYFFFLKFFWNYFDFFFFFERKKTASPPASFLGAASYLFIFWNFFWIFLIFFFFFLKENKTASPSASFLYFVFLILKQKEKKLSAAILKNSPNVRENVRSGHFERKKKEKKGLLLPIFQKKQDAKHVFFFIWPYIKIKKMIQLYR